jgi:hypothetical protein
VSEADELPHVQCAMMLSSCIVGPSGFVDRLRRWERDVRPGDLVLEVSALHVADRTRLGILVSDEVEEFAQDGEPGTYRDQVVTIERLYKTEGEPDRVRWRNASFVRTPRTRHERQVAEWGPHCAPPGESASGVGCAECERARARGEVRS